MLNQTLTHNFSLNSTSSSNSEIIQAGQRFVNKKREELGAKEFLERIEGLH
jgi:hypothetical protein